MNVRELSQEQLDELKWRYLYNVKNDYKSFSEVPKEVVINHFDGIDFVDDDFSCTCS